MNAEDRTEEWRPNEPWKVAKADQKHARVSRVIDALVIEARKVREQPPMVAWMELAFGPVCDQVAEEDKDTESFALALIAEAVRRLAPDDQA